MHRLGMPERCLHRIIDATTGAAHADHLLVDSGLGDQILERDIDIACPLRPLGANLARSQLCLRLAAALAETAIIKGQNVDARSRQLFSQPVPNFTLTIALME